MTLPRPSDAAPRDGEAALVTLALRCAAKRQRLHALAKHPRGCNNSYLLWAQGKEYERFEKMLRDIARREGKDLNLEGGSLDLASSDDAGIDSAYRALLTSDLSDSALTRARHGYKRLCTKTGRLAAVFRQKGTTPTRRLGKIAARRAQSDTQGPG